MFGRTHLANPGRAGHKMAAHRRKRPRRLPSPAQPDVPWRGAGGSCSRSTAPPAEHGLQGSAPRRRPRRHHRPGTMVSRPLRAMGCPADQPHPRQGRRRRTVDPPRALTPQTDDRSRTKRRPGTTSRRRAAARAVRRLFWWMRASDGVSHRHQTCARPLAFPATTLLGPTGTGPSSATERRWAPREGTGDSSAARGVPIFPGGTPNVSASPASRRDPLRHGRGDRQHPPPRGGTDRAYGRS